MDAGLDRTVQKLLLSTLGNSGNIASGFFTGFIAGDPITDIPDLGTYTAVTQVPLGQAAGLPPFLAGRFATNTHTGYTATNNSNTATIWVEWVAARVGVPITPAMAGIGVTRRPCPVALTIPTLADSCTAYGQGGARVTNPAGWKNESGFLTDPLATQVAAHLAKFGGFSGSDIVFAWTGGNDFLVQMRDLG